MTKHWLLVALVILLGGCNAYTVKVGDNSTTIVTDATKRLVLVSENKDKRRFVCAEPSPDAIASSIASAAAKANVPSANVNAELSGNYARAVASIGLRTASIQVLRDLSYRACEGAMNGVINDETYRELVSHLGDTTLSLIAIEGLTQMQPAPLVAISASSGTANTTSTGTSASGGSTSVTVHDTGADYKPEELQKVAETILAILKEYNREAKSQRDDTAAERQRAGAAKGK